MKNIRNEKGGVSLILLLLLLIVVFGVLTIDKERIAIADDIKKGNLVQSDKSQYFLSKGDEVLNSLKPREGEKGFFLREHYWVGIFYAKVCYERARLEMEMNKNKGE